eukprot:9994690-Prorocentrum_lima.AAC.1
MPCVCCIGKGMRSSMRGLRPSEANWWTLGDLPWRRSESLLRSGPAPGFEVGEIALGTQWPVSE